MALHPDGVAPRVANLAEWRVRLLGRLRQQVHATGDESLRELVTELSGYPGGEVNPRTPDPGLVVAPLQLWHEGAVLRFFSAVTIFGTPVDVTSSELAIESFFPADETTAAVLRARAGG